MVNETILAIIIAFAISAALCPVVIPFLHRLKFGQQVRDDGPQSHLKKQGTPTMGGLIILTATVITSLFYIKSYPRIIPILFVTVGFDHRFPGRLHQNRHEAVGRTESDPETHRSVYHYRDLHLLSDDLRGCGNRNADPVHRRI